jgi:hypothetical protein
LAALPLEAQEERRVSAVQRQPELQAQLASQAWLEELRPQEASLQAAWRKLTARPADSLQQARKARQEPAVWQQLTPRAQREPLALQAWKE